MKAVVFGGSGFLGSHVADELSRRGHQVAVFDIAPSQYLREDQRMIVGDILDAPAVLEAVQGAESVYNFAGIADLDDARTKPLETVQLNVMGNINIMDAAVAARIGRYVYASTIYVYSQKGGYYRCSKQAAELYVEEYHRRHSLDFTILRYGTLYGPRAGEGNSIRRYLRQAVEEGRIDCNGTGEELREYINVKDAAKLSVDILAEEYANKHLIISGHQAMRFRDMLLSIREIVDKDIPIEFEDEASIGHYSYTPYSYTPSIGHKLVSNMYLDMGQGLLECLNDMYPPED